MINGGSAVPSAQHVAKTDVFSLWLPAVTQTVLHPFVPIDFVFVGSMGNEVSSKFYMHSGLSAIPSLLISFLRIS